MTETPKELTIGKILKEARENSQMEIGDISEILKIKKSEIISLEEDKLILGSSNIHAFRIIKIYAKLLKIDDKLIEERAELFLGNSRELNKKYNLVNLEKKSVHSPSNKIFFYAILIFTALYLILFVSKNFVSKDLIEIQSVIDELKAIN